MALTDFDEALIEIQATEFLDSRRPPVEFRDKVDLSYRIENQSVVLFENRVNWKDATKWIEVPVAKTTFVKKTGKWKVYWQRADLKWHGYDPAKEVGSFDDFLAVVDEDEWGCFWG